MNKKLKDIMIVGFALFSMFFGAGNLIFPPSLGLITGEKWLLGGIGFIVTGVGLTMLGVIVTSKAGGRIDALGHKISPFFGHLLGFIIILAIGPGLAIPRTAATTYEIGFATTMPFMNPVIGTVVFFAIILFFALSPTNIVDRLGKILTPLLILIMAFIIVKGVIAPVGTIKNQGLDHVFQLGFEEGYQTMDALASVIFTSIVVGFIQSRGYRGKNQIVSMATWTGIVAGFFLSIMYLGLVFIGASATSVVSDEISRVELLTLITDRLYGSVGKYTLAIAISLACITTAVGLTATAAEYFSSLTKGKVSYSIFAILIAVVSGAFAITGVDAIVEVSAPILSLIYLVVIVLMVFHLVDSWIPTRGYYRGAAMGAVITSLLEEIVKNQEALMSLYEKLTNNTNIMKDFLLC
ncbi:MAG: branched-chain amino acid transport system II carrier protein, partial [Tissierellia bacterium]|nr:branched-chain amino acid transport system II carrier protein [Tissierellia bacterium]